MGVSRRRLPLWAHATLLSLMVLSAAPFMHLLTGWVGDEGAYALEVRSLQQGHWEYDYVGQTFDGRGSWFPLATGEGFNFRYGGRFYSYVKHPAYVVVERVAVGVVGDALGFHLVPMAGVVVCAMSAWLLADEIARRARALAFWLAASGPMLVNGYVMWAHAPSAAVAGMTMVAASRLAGRFRLLGAAAVFAGVLTGGLIRSEAVLFGVAIAAATLPAAWRSIGPVRAMVASGASLAGAGAAWLANRVLVEAVVHGPYASDGLRQGNVRMTFVAGRLAGAYHVLIQGSEITPTANRLLQAAAASALVGGLLLLARGRAATVAAATALIAATALVVGRFLRNPLESATGLFAAWPIAATGAVCALACLVSRGRSAAAARGRWMLPLGGTAVFAALVLLTQYAIGGGLEWGGRFLSPVAAPIAAIAALGLSEVLARRSGWARAVAAAAVVPLAVVPAAAGVRMLERYRAEKARFYAELSARSAPVIVVGVLPMIELPRGAWKMGDRFHWVMAPSPGDVPQVLAKLRAAGFHDVTLLDERSELASEDLAYPVTRDVTGPRVAGAGWALLRLQDAG